LAGFPDRLEELSSSYRQVIGDLSDDNWRLQIGWHPKLFRQSYNLTIVLSKPWIFTSSENVHK